MDNIQVRENMDAMEEIELQRLGAQRPITQALRSRPRSNAMRMSGTDIMVDFLDGRAPARAANRRASRLSMRLSSLPEPTNFEVAEAALNEPRLTRIESKEDFEDEDDDDAAPSEAEKTMTVRSGAILFCKSTLGGGASALC
jgi:hypothetical protein